ncbi:glycosyltransferase family 52 [Streptococcus bouchesdurhonensis]|uniref:glycosyltransferase family 52 n=1 Tax=Streptococcus bouchesdurhonensis TaxID=2954240 RepID=UPI0021C3CB26|nr:glycosyltransferase family 52 [Streptococcus bouchesdurhonensis]
MKNIIFCTSPFQVLVAKEVAKVVSENFIGIYLKMSEDKRQLNYAKQMEDFCEEVFVLEGRNILEKVHTFLRDKEIKNLYLASLDNPIALTIFNPDSMNLYTFDDGSTSVVPLNMYTQNLDRLIEHTNFTLSDIMSYSKKHYTVFKECILFPKEKQEILNFSTEPKGFQRAKNGKKITVFLGQALGSPFDLGDIELSKRLTGKILSGLDSVRYYPHPRVGLDLNTADKVESDLCFEEEIYLLLEKYEFVDVHGFYSTSLLLIKDIEGVSVHGYRTFLTTHESDAFQKLGVPYQNVSQSDTLVDIVMPVYNGAGTISQTIDSVLNQTHQAFRLLIIDDGSTDHTEEVCQAYLADQRIQYVKNNHQGISKSLNDGVRISQTDYVARQDSDDIWMPWHLDLLLHELETNPQLDIIGAKVIVEEDEITNKIKRNNYNHLFGEQLWLELAYRNVFNHSTVIFKRAAYEEAGGYDEHCDGFEDWHLWSRMVTKDNALVLNIVTTCYRLSERHKRGMAFRARLARSRGLRLEDVLE